MRVFVWDLLTEIATAKELRACSNPGRRSNVA
jgi:hypothetical protein